MDKNYLNVREDFRAVMLKTLGISFPRMVWRHVLKILSKEQARTLLDVMKSDDFYWLFMVSPNLPDDFNPKYLEIFENPKLAEVMNVFRLAKIQAYLQNRNVLSIEMQDFLEALFCYLKSFASSSKCCCENFIKAQQHFQQEEISLLQKVDTLSEEEKDLFVFVAVIAIEEFSQPSFEKIMSLCGLTA